MNPSLFDTVGTLDFSQPTVSKTAVVLVVGPVSRFLSSQMENCLVAMQITKKKNTQWNNQNEHETVWCLQRLFFTLEVVQCV